MQTYIPGRHRRRHVVVADNCKTLHHIEKETEDKILHPFPHKHILILRNRRTTIKPEDTAAEASGNDHKSSD